MQINEAVKKINQILKDLEAATGSVVENIQLDQIDVTQFQDDRQQLAVTVAIELKRNPGHRWS